MFDASKCNDCGSCFVNCHYVDYSPEKAVSEIKALKQSKQADILHSCITCMACNEYCAQGANPYDLICALQEKNAVGLVSVEKMALIENMLAGKPNKIIRGEPDKPALSLCVMDHAFPPDIMQSRMFSGLTLLKGGDYYSRIVYLHMGRESTTKAHARHFIDNLSKINKDEIIFCHDDCYVLAAKKAQEYCIAVPFKPVHIVEYMLTFFKAHPKSISNLDRKIAVQRPCISRLIPESERWVDEFFNVIGAQRIDRCYDRGNAICCGIGLVEKYPGKSKELIQINITDAQEHGAEAMVFLCPSCYWHMSEACEQSGLASIFITDLGRMALGEIPFSSRPCRQKTNQM